MLNVDDVLFCLLFQSPDMAAWQNDYLQGNSNLNFPQKIILIEVWDHIGKGSSLLISFYISLFEIELRITFIN